MIGPLTRIGAQYSRSLVLVILVCNADSTPASSPIKSCVTLTRTFPASCSIGCVILVSFILAAWRWPRPLLSETKWRSASRTSFRRNPSVSEILVYVTETYQNNTNLESSSNVSMGRTVDQDVHAAFVEFRAKGNDAHQHLHWRAAACSSSPMLICVQKTTSASLCNASTVNRSEQRTLHARSNIFSSALASQTILMPHVPNQVLEMEAQPLQMAFTEHQP